MDVERIVGELESLDRVIRFRVIRVTQAALETPMCVTTPTEERPHWSEVFENLKPTLPHFDAAFLLDGASVELRVHMSGQERERLVGLLKELVRSTCHVFGHISLRDIEDRIGERVLTPSCRQRVGATRDLKERNNAKRLYDEYLGYDDEYYRVPRRGSRQGKRWLRR
jgi:hypothetical protein